MKCDCITKIDGELKSKNLEISGVAFLFPDMRTVPYINCQWIDKTKATKGKKNSPPYMLASFCPFCGQPVEEKK